MIKLLLVFQGNLIKILIILFYRWHLNHMDQASKHFSNYY